MKRPEEYLIELWDNWNPGLDWVGNPEMLNEYTSKVIDTVKQAQIDAYNEALDDAVEKGMLHKTVYIDETCSYSDIFFVDPEHNEYEIDKQSILKLKK